MLTDLQNAFKGWTVTKEVGQQDGPDFPLYSIKTGNNESAFWYGLGRYAETK